MNVALKGISNNTRVLLRLTQNATRTSTTRFVLKTAFQSRCLDSMARPACRLFCTSTAPMENDLNDVHIGKECLKIPGILGDMNYIWLRENCPCPSCYTSNQMVVHSHHIDADIRPHSAAHSNGELQLVWPDGHVSNFNVEWLKENSYPPPTKLKTSKIYWGRDDLQYEDLPRVNVQDFMKSDDGVKEVLRSVMTYGVGIVDGVLPTKASTIEVGGRMSHLQATVYGGLMSELSGLGDYSDRGYTKKSLEAHTDFPYSKHQPGILIFHCIQPAEEGGLSYFVDGFHVAQQLRTEHPDMFHLLSTVRVPFRSLAIEGERRDFYSPELTFSLDPISNDIEAIRYNHYNRAPINTIPQTEMAAFYEALSEFSRRIEDPCNHMQLLMTPGTMLFLDNFRMIHGRTSFKGRRTLLNAFHAYDEPRNRARLMGLM